MAKIKHQIGIVGDIKKIYRSMYEPTGLTGWWATKSDGIPEVGEVINLYFADLVTLTFKIIELNENTQIHLFCIAGPDSWMGCGLTFSFLQDNDQVWVGLTHENNSASDDEFLYFNTKWPVYLLSLRDLIETGKGRPYPNDVKIHLED